MCSGEATSLYINVVANTIVFILLANPVFTGFPTNREPDPVFLDPKTIPGPRGRHVISLSPIGLAICKNRFFPFFRRTGNRIRIFFSLNPSGDQDKDIDIWYSPIHPIVAEILIFFSKTGILAHCALGIRSKYGEGFL